MSNTDEQEKPLLPTKDQMYGPNGQALTQGLFLEAQYSHYAVYSLKDDDCEYNGRIYPSIKKLYLEMEDPTEYDFATKYLLGIKHWYRIYDNKLLQPHIDEWRFELEMKLRAKGIKKLISAAKGGNLSAAKFLVDRGWSDKRVGRPSKEDLEREKKIRLNISEEYEEDLKRLAVIK